MTFENLSLLQITGNVEPSRHCSPGETDVPVSFLQEWAHAVLALACENNAGAHKTPRPIIKTVPLLLPQCIVWLPGQWEPPPHRASGVVKMHVAGHVWSVTDFSSVELKY
jgi:hypothetical protein